jgi:hypothetical protein
MPNSINADFMTAIFARASLKILRESLPIARLVNRDFENEFAQAGDTVNTRRPKKMTATAFNPSTGVTVSAVESDTVPIVLNQHPHVAFEISDVEQSKSPLNLVQTYIDPAGLAIANAIDKALLGLYTDIINVITVASDGQLKDKVNEARTRLNKKMVPTDNRHLVLSDDDEGALSGVAQFERANETPNQTLTEGTLPRLKGFTPHRSSNVLSLGSPNKRQNLAFHRDFATIVVRPLATSQVITNGSQYVMSDPDGGNSIRVTQSYEPRYFRHVVSLDTIFGVKTLDRDMAVVLKS